MTKLKTLKRKLWNIISRYVRIKASNDFGYVTCYTCSKPFQWDDVDAGHGISGRSNSVLFDLELIRPQCRYCNRMKHGEEYIFGTRLNEENGVGWYEQKKIDSRKPLKYYRTDLEEMIDEYKQLLKEVEQARNIR